MKILFVTYGNSYGGSLKMLSWLSNSLSSYHDITYCNLGNNKLFYKLNEKVKYVELNCNKINSFLYRNTIAFLQSVKRLYKLQKENKYDLVLNFADHALYSILIVKPFVNQKIVISQRVDPHSCTKVRDKIRIWLYQYCDGLVCQTDSALPFFSDKIKKNIKTTVIANPAIRKANEFWNPLTNQGYLVSLARLDFKQKRQDILLDAYKIVHELYPDIKLFLYADATHGSDIILNDMIIERNLEGSAIYKGVTKDSLDVLRRAGMLILSSDYEGIPNVLLEGMDVGVPIVTTDFKSGGARLLFDTDDKGTVVPCGDAKKLADAIIHNIQNKEQAAAKAKIAQESLNRFSEEIIIKKWLKFLESFN